MVIALGLYSDTELTTRRGLYPRSFMNFVINSTENEFDEELGDVVSRIIHKAPDYTIEKQSIKNKFRRPRTTYYLCSKPRG